MLKVTPLKQTGKHKGLAEGSKPSADKIAKYYLTEEKSLALQHNAHMEKAVAEKLGLSFSEKDYSQYVLAETAHVENSWFGNLADKLDLTGKPVTEQVLSEFLNGQIPGHGFVQRRSDGTRRQGYDFMFSAPKGFSIMAEVFGDTRLKELHAHSVKAALRAAQNMIAEYRTHNAELGAVERISTDQLIFALVHHKTSRARDPQTHTHAILPNVTMVNGKAKALMIDNLYEQKLNLLIGRIYQAEMNKGAIACGYSTMSLGNGQYDLSEIPREVIEKTSKRRMEILKIAKEFGLPMNSPKDVAALISRDPKDYEGLSVVESLWKAAFDTYEEDKLFDGRQLLKKSIGLASLEKNTSSNSGQEKARDKSTSINVNSITTALANKALASSIIDLSRYTTSLHYHQIIEKALGAVDAQSPLSFIEIKNALDAKISRGEMIPLDGDATRLTTKKCIEDEKQLIANVRQQVRGLSIQIKEKRLEECDLSESNTRVIQSLFESSKQSSLVNTLGKNHDTIAALLHAGENSGKKITVLTPNSYHMRDRNAHVARQSKNIFQWVRNQFKGEHAQLLGNFIAQQAQDNSLSRDDIIVVDQANQLSIEDAQQLLQLTQGGKAKIVFLNNELRRGFHRGNIIESLKSAEIESHTWQAESSRPLNYTIVDVGKEKFASKAFALKELQPNSLVLCSSRKEVTQLNTVVRDQLKDKGTLSRYGDSFSVMRPIFLSKEAQLNAKSYVVGGQLNLVNQAGKRYQYRIQSINAKANTLVLENDKGRLSHFNPAKQDFKHLFHSTLEKMELCAGDTLIYSGQDFAGLMAGQTYHVKNTDRNWIRLIAGSGETIKLSHAQFKTANLHYDYARTLEHLSGKEQRPLIGIFKSYLFKKETLQSIEQKCCRHIPIYTDDADKCEKTLKKNNIKTSAIRSVVESAQQFDRGVTKLVTPEAKELTGKLVGALDQLNTEYEKDVLTKAVEHAVDLLSDRETAFTEAQVLDHAVSFAKENYDVGVSYDEILKKLASDPEYLPGVERTWWTTQTAIDTERFVIDKVNHGKGVCQSLMSEEKIKAALTDQKYQHLTSGQRDAVCLLSSSKDRYVMVQGYAGTGKSTMLDVVQQSVVTHLKEVFKEAEKEIHFIGLAPTHSAVNALKEKNMPAQTMQSFLFDYKDQENLDLSRHVLILDESSMVSNSDFKLLTDIVEKSGARLALVGDEKQVEAIGAGALFRLLQAKSEIAKVTMKEFMRQEEEASKKGVRELYNEDTVAASQYFSEQKSRDQVDYQQQPNKIELSVVESGSTESMLVDVAKEYLARTPECRAQTIVIANSHEERRTITDRIRDGLHCEGSLGKSIKLMRWVNKNVTENEMKNLGLYEVGQVFQEGNDYYCIHKIDGDNKLLTLTHTMTGEQKTIAPMRLNHRFNGLFEQDDCQLSINDIIVPKVTDKPRGLQANEAYRVTQVGDGTFTLEHKASKKIVTLSATDTKYHLWDYAYTSTTIGSQGQTKPFTIVANKARSPLANLMTDLVAKTRHKIHLMIFVDDKAKYLQAVQENDGRNKIALEVVGDVNLSIKKRRSFAPPGLKNNNKMTENKIKSQLQAQKSVNRESFDKDKLQAQIQQINAQNEAAPEVTIAKEKVVDPRYQDAQGKFDMRLYGKAVAKDLVFLTREVAEHYLGKSNTHFSSSHELRFGNKGSLTVTLTGQHAGKWVNFETGERGDLISLIMAETGMTYSEAVKEGARFTQTPEAYQIREVRKFEPTVVPKAKKSDYGLRLWSEGKPIKGTLAETYLTKHRALNNIYEADLRFHQGVYSKESSTKKQPALLAAFKNAKGEVQAVEAIYLDKKTGNKAGFEVGKRSYGSKSGAVVSVGKGKNSQTTYLAEGVVTALSVKEALPDAHVLSMGGQYNFNNVAGDLLHENVVLCGDNDLLDTPEKTLLQKAKNRLQGLGKMVHVVMPSMKDLKEKFDYNDLLIKQGKQEVVRQLKPKSQHSIDSLLTNTDSKWIAEMAKNKGKNLSNDFDYSPEI